MTDPKTLRNMLRVYFIAGSTNCKHDVVEVVEEAIRGGITLFQFREKGKDAAVGQEKMQLAKRIQALCKENHIPFIVNDDVDLALAIDADGVHIGQKDEDAKHVRKRIGDKILGVSVHSLDDAHLAIANGADYFGVGPIFPTQSKDDAEPVRGTEVIEIIRKNGLDTPIVGIGGIHAGNADEVMAAGADGVSVISAISLADSSYEAAKQLAEAVKK
ncbi:thiamine phosphate synthase [Ectobacillus polymachus]|uniref:thiamine phosphate synthase n=1 Tax=Ectobacillus polymachus TaxID=1508806 RepID=UPI003A83A53E